MQSILSIQSHVAYGYVGNRAAVFPLQRLGFDVTVINTVQFSNHSGYGSLKGDVFSPEHLRSLIDGIRERGVFPHLNAVLSGYMGDASLGSLIIDVVQELKTITPSLIYCCDPVIGDVGRGVFVRPGIGEYFRDHVVPVADVLTPNQFELNFLTGIEIESLGDALRACEALRARGPHTILVTSLVLPDTPEHKIQMLLSTANGTWLIETPRFDIVPAPTGAGDMTAALFLGHLLLHESPAVALEKMAASVYGIFEKTFNTHSRELQIIPAQEEIVMPTHVFKAKSGIST
jgi:pyridoxine kinase